jgi:hypothetical protein
MQDREAHAETIRVQDELGALLHAAEAERDGFRAALKGLSTAVKALGKIGTSGKTLFESNDDEAVRAWRSLNDAQAVARHLIGGQAMAPEGLPRKLPGQADDR